MLNGVFLTILETKICVCALPNCWWFMCMNYIYKTHFIFILFYLGGKGRWGVYGWLWRGLRGIAFCYMEQKYEKKVPTKFKWAYKRGLRMHAKRGTLWMPFVCILPIECPLFRAFYALCLLKLTMQKNLYGNEEVKKKKEKRNPQ